MRKIRDRLMLGAICGIGGNIVKNAIQRFSMSKKWAEVDGPARAAGMLVAGHKISTPGGKVVGYLADSIVAGLVGVTAVYVLSVTGHDRAKLKGALTGQTVWTALYGVLGTMGATKVYHVGPGTVLSEFVAHSAFGATATFLAAKLGDPDLFNGQIPLSASKFHTAVNINIEEKQSKPSPVHAEPKFEKHHRQFVRHTDHGNHYRRSEHRGLH